MGEDGCVAMGLGYEGEYDPTVATLSKKLFTRFKALLNDHVGLTQDGIEDYGATKRVPTVLKDEVPAGFSVEAVQLEIQGHVFAILVRIWKELQQSSRRSSRTRN